MVENGLRGSFHERATGSWSGAHCRDRTATLGEVQGCRSRRVGGSLEVHAMWQLGRAGRQGTVYGVRCPPSILNF